jgi:hypothetical protein
VARPLISALAFRISAGIVLTAGLGAAAFWMVTRSGPFPLFMENVDFGSAEEGLFGAMCLTFLVTVVPCLGLIVSLYAVSDMPSLKQELAALKAPSVAEARRLGGDRAARTRQELENVRSPDARAVTRARAVAAVGGALAGFLRQDVIPEGLRTYGASLVAVGFLLTAVLLDRGRGRARALQAGALALIVGGVVLPTQIYMSFREDFYLIEFLIPITIGMLPGLLLHWAIWRKSRAAN